MARLRILFALIAFVIGISSGRADVISPEAAGLKSSPSETKLIAQAVEIANIAMANKGREFVLGTSSSQLKKGQVPVFILASFKLAPTDTLWVPKGCECVYVHARGLRKLLKEVRDAEGWGEEFDERYVVAIFLLHEMGHIDRGVAGAVGVFSATGEVNLDKSAFKDEETKADDFAESAIADSLSDSSKDKKTGDEILKNLTTLAKNLYFGVSLTQDLAHLMCTYPDIYWDATTTHPNMTFRFMTMLDRLARSDMTVGALKLFKECRSKDEAYFEKLNGVKKKDGK